MSDVLTIDSKGVLMVRRIQEKFYVGEKLLDIRVLRPGQDWVFNLIYRDGKDGVTYAKRFHLGGFTRNKEYDLTQGTKGSRIFFFSVHATEEASAAIKVNVYLKNQLKKLRRPIPFDFAKLRVKGRAVMGNIVTKNPVERIARMIPEPTSDAEVDEAPPAEATAAQQLPATPPVEPQAPVAEPAEAAPPAAEQPEAADEQLTFDI